jgi:hypothetical protein
MATKAIPASTKQVRLQRQVAPGASEIAP